MTRRCFLAVPVFAPLAPSAQLPPFPAWDRDVAERLLTESPWAQALETPLRDRAYKSELYLTVRWASALPVRRANAIALGLESRAGKLMLASEPKEYVIEIAGFPAGALKPGGPAGLEKELLATATVRPGKRAPLQAVSVTVPEFGSHLMAELRFKRSPAITPADEQVEFTASVLGGRVKIQAKFALKPMVYEGKLEL
jgi:hypothetical protein